MRKLILLLLTVVTGILINFGFWFFQIQAIRENLNNLKSRLAEQGVELEFNDVKFTNFKSWNVKGIIEEVRITPYITDKDSGLFYKFEMHNIKMESNPVKKTFKLIFPSTINIEEKLFKESQKYALVYTKQAPAARIVFKLNQHFWNFKQYISSGKPKDFFDFVKESKFDQAEVDFIDLSNGNQKIGHFKYLSLYVGSDLSKDGLKVQIKLHDNGSEYNSEYKAGNPKWLQFMHDNFVKLGTSSSLFDLKLEYKKQDGEFSNQRTTINRIEVNNKLFNIILIGNIDKAKDNLLPNFNLDLTITDYDKLAAYFAGIYNGIIDISKIRLKLLSDRQVKELAGFLKRFSEKDMLDNQTKLKFIKTSRGTTVTGEPIIQVIKELKGIFS